MRRSKSEQNAEISADAVGEVEHGIVSHWFAPLKVRLIHCCYWHCWKYDSIYHQLSAPQLQEQRWSKFIHLTKIPFKMICFSGGGWDAIIWELPARLWCFQVLPGIVKTGSVEWSWRACLLLAAYTLLICVFCLWNRYISVFGATLQAKKKLNPYWWGVFHFHEALHRAYINDTEVLMFHEYSAFSC